MHPFPANLRANISIGGHTHVLRPNESICTPKYRLAWQQSDWPKGHQWHLLLDSQEVLKLDQCSLRIPLRLGKEDMFFGNGYQSWSESRAFHPTESIPTLRRLAQPFMGYYGDYHIPAVKRGKRYLHSWTWTYVLRPENAPLFFGSLTETESFTLFQYDQKEQVLNIEREAGDILQGTRILLGVYLSRSALSEAYAEWFQHQGIRAAPSQNLYGWTSWYQYYNRIDGALIRDTLTRFQQKNIQLDYFQIDDGYQKQIGDWLDVKSVFPQGMRALAQDIQQAGYQAGIWLAPYVAAANSRLVQEHPDWIQKDPTGKRLQAGYNPMWGGFFYALDPLHEGVRQYLREVFRTLIDDWGYQLIKLDFLYAACIYPRSGWTRAALCYESTRYLRELAGPVKLLGCGVPLGPTFGLFDYCRVAADIHLRWEHKPLAWVRHRERVSTLVALRTLLNRYPLDGLAWCNDPDVFLLRDNNQHLSVAQRQTVARINALCGHLHFNNDQMDQYTPAQVAQWEEIKILAEANITKVGLLQKDVYLITYDLPEHKRAQMWVNLTRQSISVSWQGETVSVAAYSSSIRPFLQQSES